MEGAVACETITNAKKPALVAGFFMRGRIGGMAGKTPSWELLNFVGLSIAIALFLPAIALVELRGPKSLWEHVAIRLFLALCASVWVVVFWEWYNNRRHQK